MATRCTAMIALAIAFVGTAWAAEDTKTRGQCVQNAIAARLEFTPEQKEQAAKICSEYEGKSAPVCEKLWTLQNNHRHAVLQILSTEQRAKLPEIVKAEGEKILDSFTTKLQLTDAQRKELEKICTEYGPKYEELADSKDTRKSEKFQDLRAAHFEAMCKVLNDDQRVKLPVLIQEEIQARTPSSKSDIRNAIVDRLGLDADQKARLDKVCDDFGPKIEEQKVQLWQLCKDKHAAISKILTEAQRVKFEEYAKVAFAK